MGNPKAPEASTNWRVLALEGPEACIGAMSLRESGERKAMGKAVKGTPNGNEMGKEKAPVFEAFFQPIPLACFYHFQTHPPW